MDHIDASIQCPECKAEITGDKSFCENCGAQIKEGVQRQSARPRKRLGNLAGAQHKKKIRGARIALMFVAIVTVLVSGFFWVVFNSEVESLRGDAGVIIDESLVTQQKLIISSSFGTGLIFFGLFFWAKKNPFGACLTGLIIYITNILISAALDPASLPQGILIKIIIIVALVNGVKSGLAYKNMAKAEEQSI